MPRYKHPRKTWQYSTDFKVKAVELSHQEGIEVQQIAAGLDILRLCFHGGVKSTAKAELGQMVENVWM